MLADYPPQHPLGSPMGSSGCSTRIRRAADSWMMERIVSTCQQGRRDFGNAVDSKGLCRFGYNCYIIPEKSADGLF